MGLPKPRQLFRSTTHHVISGFGYVDMLRDDRLLLGYYLCMFICAWVNSGISGVLISSFYYRFHGPRLGSPIRIPFEPLTNLPPFHPAPLAGLLPEIHRETPSFRPIAKLRIPTFNENLPIAGLELTEAEAEGQECTLPLRFPSLQARSGNDADVPLRLTDGRTEPVILIEMLGRIKKAHYILLSYSLRTYRQKHIHTSIL